MALFDVNDPTAGDRSLTEQQLSRRQRLLADMIKQSMAPRPMTSWTQVLAQTLEGATAGIEQARLDKAEREAGARDDAQAARMGFGFSGGSANPIVSNSAVTSSTPTRDSGGATTAAGAAVDPVANDLAPHQRAFLNAVAGPESAGKYDVRYTPNGGAKFVGFDKHPRIFEPGPEGPSSAAGRYQFTATTWDNMGGGNFSPENQDRRAWELGVADYRRNTGRDLDADLRAGGFTPQIAKSLQDTWRGFRDNPGKAIRAYSDSMARYSNAPQGRVQVASAAPATMTDAAPAPVQVAWLPPTSAPVAPAPAQMTGALPSMAAANMGLLPPPPIHWPSGPGKAEPNAAVVGPPTQMAAIEPAATPFPGRKSVVIDGADTSQPGATAAPASGQMTAARGAAPAQITPPTPPARPVATTPQPRTQSQALAAAMQQPMGVPEAIADRAAVLDIARGGAGVPQATPQALGAALASPAAPGAPAPPVSQQALAAAVNGGALPAGMSKRDVAMSLLASRGTSEHVRRLATIVLQQEGEQQRHTRDLLERRQMRDDEWRRQDEKEARQAPTVRKRDMLDGSTADEQWNPQTKTWDLMAPPGATAGAPAGASTVPPVPPGVDPKEWRKQHSERAATEAMPASPETVASLRKEIQQLPSYKNMAQAAPIYRSMMDAAGRDTKAADLNMVYGLGKIFDPTSVVREGEIVMANDTQGLADKLNGFIKSIQGEGRLRPEAREQIMREAFGRMISYKTMFDQESEFYRGIATRGRMNVLDVLPNFGEFEEYKLKPSAATPAPAAPVQTPSAPKPGNYIFNPQTKKLEPAQ